MEVPKDLKVKIGSKEEVFWTGLRDKIKEDILQAERQILVNKEILRFTEERIKIEQKV